MVKINLYVRIKTFPCENYYNNSYSKLHVQSYWAEAVVWGVPRQEITY